MYLILTKGNNFYWIEERNFERRNGRQSESERQELRTNISWRFQCLQLASETDPMEVRFRQRVKIVGLNQTFYLNPISQVFRLNPWMASSEHADHHFRLNLKVADMSRPRDKTNKVSVRPVKTQISLGIRPVWSEFSLCAQWVAKDTSFSSCGQRRLWSDWADSQADLSLRWAHNHIVVFVTRRLIFMMLWNALMTSALALNGFNRC